MLKISEVIQRDQKQRCREQCPNVKKTTMSKTKNACSDVNSSIGGGMRDSRRYVLLLEDCLLINAQIMRHHDRLPTILATTDIGAHVLATRPE